MIQIINLLNHNYLNKNFDYLVIILNKINLWIIILTYVKLIIYFLKRKEVKICKDHKSQ